MPLVYADTSVLFAYFHPRDEFSIAIGDAVRAAPVDFVYWSFLRFELRHNLRQSRVDSYGEIGWKALRAAEKTSSRLAWQPGLECESLLEVADQISSTNAAVSDAGAADLLHVAAAMRITDSIVAFWTCDSQQARLARAVGVKIREFKPSRKARE